MPTCTLCHRDLIPDEKRWTAGKDLLCASCLESLLPSNSKTKRPPSYAAAAWLACFFLIAGISALLISLGSLFWPLFSQERYYVQEITTFAWNACANGLILLTASAILYFLRAIARNTYKS